MMDLINTFFDKKHFKKAAKRGKNSVKKGRKCTRLRRQNQKNHENFTKQALTGVYGQEYFPKSPLKIRIHDHKSHNHSKKQTKHP